MNLFGSFTFGSLIKTFIPGLVWALAMLLYWRDADAWLPKLLPSLPSTGDGQTLLVLAIPVGILLGLLSNIVVFMGVNDWLVRHRVQISHAPLYALYKGLSQQVRHAHWAAMAGAPPELEAEFNQHADPEMLILKTIGLTEFAYVREQYWYHLEFQVNMLLATAFTLPAVIASPALLANGFNRPLIIRTILVVLAFGGLCILLRQAALKNYVRHLQKTCTLMAAHLSTYPVAAQTPAGAPP